MRIVHAINSLELGGAEQVVKDLAGWQIRHGHDVRILTLHPGWKASAGSRNREPTDDVSSIHGPGSYLQSVPWLWRHRNSLLNADVVHAHLTFGSFVGALTEIFKDIERRSGPVVIETDHSAGMPITYAQRTAYSLMRRRRQGVATVVPNVHSVKRPKRAMSWGIPNGIAPLPQRNSWCRGEVLTLGSLGRLRVDRQPYIYLDLLEYLLSERKARLLYGGDGPYREQLESEIARRGLAKNVDFFGVVVDKVQFLNSIDLHVSLAVGSQVGLASLESASSATPSLAVQLQPKYSGLQDPIPSSSSATELHDFMAPLVDSEDRRRALGLSQARYVRENRSIEAMGLAYMAAYDAAIAEIAL